MTHWLVYKMNHGVKEFISKFDDFGECVHTTKQADALRFDNFYVAMSYYHLGYCIEKEN